MLSDGVVLRLTRDYFIDLISEPLLQEVSHDRAEDLVGIGARWIDVRLREEFERDGLEGAVNIPLGELRARIRELKRGASYVTYCNAGRRAQAAAFLLCQRGIHACSLRGGISHKRPAGRGSRRPHKSLPELHAALVRADAELDRALQRKAEADAAHEVEARLAGRSATQSNAEDYLKQLTTRAQTAEQVLRAAMERKRELETRVRDAEADAASRRRAAADAASRRRAAEEECMHMRQMAQERLEAEKRGLENHYREASERLKRIDDWRRRSADSRTTTARRASA
jgi:rhodanese-related sulfurtransferase